MILHYIIPKMTMQWFILDVLSATYRWNIRGRIRVCRLGIRSIQFHKMIRILTILMLISAGLPRLGVGFVVVQGMCSESTCHQSIVQVSCCQPVVQIGCCSSDSGDYGFCPMSNGPCECVAAPAPFPEPKPEAPMPRSDRDSVTGMPNGPPQVTTIIELDSDAPRVASLVLALTAGKSHNEIQALLGTWRM